MGQPGRKDDCAALTKTDAGMAWAFAETAQDNLVAFGEESAGFTGGKSQRFDTVTGQLEQATRGGELWPRDGAGGKKVTHL